MATALSPTTVKVTWAAPQSTITGYSLQRKLGDDPWTTVVSSLSASSVGSYTDNIPTQARNYQYRLRATNGAVASDWVESNAVAVPAPCSNRDTNLSDAATKGCFGPVVDWPLVPTFSALMPNGKVIGWYASDDTGKYREHTAPHNQQPRNGVLYSDDGTMVAVWDPASGKFQDASMGNRSDQSVVGSSKGTDLFCAGFSLLSDGRFFTAGGNMGYTYGSIRTNIYDPAKNTWTLGPDTTVPDMWRDRWYPTVTKLPDGKLLITGGTAMADANFKDGQTDPACPTGGCPKGLEGTGNTNDNASKQGIKGGFNNAFEVYDPGGSNGKYLRMLQTNASAVPSFEHYYPWWHVATNGLVFLAGAGKDKGYLDVNNDKWYGPYSTDNAPGVVNFPYNDAHRVYGTSVMYEPGKVMLFGGGYAAGGDANTPPTIRNNWVNGNTTIHITLGSNPAVAPTMVSGPKMAHHRTHPNATLMANGSVFVNGGQEDASPTASWFNTVNPLTVWNIDLAVFDSEVWNPPTSDNPVGSFIQGPKAVKPRMYHSVAMLLPDGTVFTGAGGGCGFCNAKSTYGIDPAAWGSAHDQPDKVNQKSHEIYYPAYLFKADGALAPRPVISLLSAPVENNYPTLAYNSSVSVQWSHPEAGHSIGKVNLIALGAPTHSFNENQRFLSLDFTSTGNTLSIKTPFDGEYGAPKGRYDAPPGFYMLFILDDKGVPSMAKVVRLQ